MTSTSSGGSSLITLQFALELEIDVAEQEVQAAINAAGDLPAARPARTRRSTARSIPADAPDPDAGAHLRHAAARRRSQDLADTRLAQKISQLPGVGLVSLSGGQKPAVRVQANPTALAAYGLSLEDLRTAIAAANVNQAKGNFDGPRRPSRSAPTTSCSSSERVPDARRRLPQRRAGAAVRRRRRGRRRRERPAGRVDERRRRPSSSTSSASPGANIIEVVDRIKRCCRSCRPRCPPAVRGHDPHRPHRRRSAPRCTTCSSS